MGKSDEDLIDVERFKHLDPSKERKKDWTYIVAIIDRSGSMKALQETAIAGFNKFLEDQKKAPEWAEFTLALFNTTNTILYDDVPIQEVKPLDMETYVPDGWTALYDALGTAIMETKAHIEKLSQKERPAKVLFMILTDGEENYSKKYKQAAINTMIEAAQTDSGWAFLYLAANPAAFKAGEAMGIAKGTSFQFSATPVGTQSAFGALSRASCAVRSSRGLSSQAVVKNMSADIQGMLAGDDVQDPAASTSWPKLKK